MDIIRRCKHAKHYVQRSQFLQVRRSPAHIYSLVLFLIDWCSFRVACMMLYFHLHFYKIFYLTQRFMWPLLSEQEVGKTCAFAFQ